MKALILAATHERAIDSRGLEVPRPLLDLDEEPLLTQMIRRLTKLSEVKEAIIVTNEAIRAELEAWARALPSGLVAVSILGDGTRTPDERRGAMGDLIFALEAAALEEDLLVIGGDNWFTYDLRVLVTQGYAHSPAVVVTPLAPGARVSRFGIAQVGSEGKITAFREKPESTITGFKASCAYYFAAKDLGWLRMFARERDPRCSPGIFLEWLVERTPVFAVPVEAAWYDVGVGEARRLSGPGLLRFRQIVREVVNPVRSTWERVAGQRLQWVSSYEDLLDALDDPDPNFRIVASDVLGRISELIDAGALVRISDRLVRLLGDSAFNQIAYGGSQADEESVIYVSSSAAASLVRLNYATDVDGVFARARQEGQTVCEH